MSSADLPEAQISRMFIDPLTGVYTRALFDVRLREEFSRAQRYGSVSTLCLFDIDHFKSINDAYGHLRGDEILRDFVREIQPLIRGSDALFRYGGDEFVLLLPETNKEQAMVLCERIFERLRRTIFDGDPPLTLTISMGVASYPIDASEPEALLGVADRRSYVAKRQGRGRFITTDPVSQQAIDFEHQSRLVERDHALEATHVFFQALAQHQNGVMSIVGGHGVGRTRFLESLSHAAQLRNLAVMTVRGRRDLLYRPLGALQAARWPTQLPVDAGLEALERALVQGVTAKEKAGLLIAVDDLQLLDRASIELLQQLLLSKELPVLALAYTSVPGVHTTRFVGPTPLEMEVSLEPLTEKGLRIWLRSLLHQELSEPFVQWLHKKTGGFPARVRDLLRALVAEQLLKVGASGSWELSPSYQTATLGTSDRARPSSNLPVVFTELFGREKVCADIEHLLKGCRLVTLSGPGGIGKTRLSLAVAAARQDLHPDGVWFVGLETLRSPEYVLSAIARTLGIKESGGQPLLESMKAYLHDKAMLLVLDNFEHVLDAAPTLLELLGAAPNLQLLITSRERLNVSGEQLFAVPPLTTPNPQQLPSLRQLQHYGAIALYLDRARAVQHDFQLTEANALPIAEVCARLEGIPLALELAAVRSDQFTPEALLAQLDRRLMVLQDGPRNLAARQRTLRSTIEWSYSLLSHEEQVLFARLGVFVGGGSLVAIERICGQPLGEEKVDIDEADAAALQADLSSLVQKNLLQEHAHQDGSRGFRMLETIREYALEQLAQHDEYDPLHARHALYFLDLGERAEPWLVGKEQRAWLDQLERNKDNLRSALQWFLDRNDIVKALRLATAVWKFWQFRGYDAEGRRWLKELLMREAAYSAEGSAKRTADEVQHVQALRAKAMFGSGWLAFGHGDTATMARMFEESLAISEVLGDERATGLALQGIGAVAMFHGDHARAKGCFEKALVIFEALDDKEELAWVTHHLANAARHEGDLAAAEALHHRTLTFFREIGHSWGIGSAMIHLAQTTLFMGHLVKVQELLVPWLDEHRARQETQGIVYAQGLTFVGEAALFAGDLDQAKVLLQEALRLTTTEGYINLLSMSLRLMARLAVVQDNLEEARLCLRQSLQAQLEVKDAMHIIHVLQEVAGFAVKEQRWVDAARLCGFLLKERERARIPMQPLYATWFEDLVLTTRAALGAEIFELHDAYGGNLTSDQALDYAIAFLNTSPTGHTPAEVLQTR